MTNAIYLPQGLAGAGDYNQMNSNTLGNPVIILNGNPALQRLSQSNNDSVYIFANANPFESGSGICAMMMTTNVSLASSTNAVSTNLDGVKIYTMDQFALFFYALAPEGVPQNGPGTVGLVANQHRFILSSPGTIGGVSGNYVGLEFVPYSDSSGLYGTHFPLATSAVFDVTNSTNADVLYVDQYHGNLRFGNAASAGTSNTATFGGTNFLFISNSKQGMKIYDGFGYEAFQAFGQNGGEVAFYDESGNNFAVLGDNGLQAVKGGLTTTVTSQSVNYSVANADSTVLVAATGKVVTLPSATAGYGAGRQFTVKLTASGTCTITNATGAQTIDGALSYTLSAQYKYVTVQSDGANWNVIGNN